MAELCVTFSVLLNTFLYIRMFCNELTCFCSKKSTYTQFFEVRGSLTNEFPNKTLF